MKIIRSFLFFFSRSELDGYDNDDSSIDDGREAEISGRGDDMISMETQEVLRVSFACVFMQCCFANSELHSDVHHRVPQKFTVIETIPGFW